MLDLEGKVILVTGGSRGIGEATVRLLETLGAKVAHLSRTPPSSAYGHYVAADVTDSAELEKAVSGVETELGPIYGVVANAGINQDNFFTKLDKKQWDEVLDTNLTGVFNTLQATVRRLYERKAGAVVTVSSIVGERGNLGQVNYAAAKAGVIGMTKALALEASRYNVRANVVAPGFIATDMVEHLPETVKEKILKQIPFNRFGRPEEVAWAIAYLLSPRMSSYVTGETLRVNGGQYT